MIEKLIFIPEKYLSELILLANSYGLKTPLRIAHFVAQVMEESANFTHVQENLNYSAIGLLGTWPKHFPDIQTANAYARQPEKIANRAYANRDGNGDENSGDGWSFRGRGLIQITGRYNYETFGISIKEPIADTPDVLIQPHYAVLSALWFWVKNCLNDEADKGSDAAIVQEITKRINGGLTGYTQRLANFEKVLAILNTDATQA